jgi:Domain of unknown function (DUF1918)
MQAHPGDQLVIRGTHVGAHDRKGEVLEARGPNDTEPFLVRWDDDGHTTLFFPGTDCTVERPANAASSGGIAL